MPVSFENVFVIKLGRVRHEQMYVEITAKGKTEGRTRKREMFKPSFAALDTAWGFVRSNSKKAPDKIIFTADFKRNVISDIDFLLFDLCILHKFKSYSLYIEKRGGEITLRKKEERKEKLSDMPRITLLGRRSLYVENFCAVVVYTEKEIQLNTAEFLLKITGENLEIRTLAQGLLEIIGEIFDVSIQK